jgi:hypothetical protein
MTGDFGGQRSGPGRGYDRNLGADDGPQMAVPRGSGEAGEFEVPGPYRDWSGMAGSSDGPERCQFLRAIAPDGTLFDPGHEAVANHRCAAFGDPLPLSMRQQELVCLQRVHVSCPRYMRGTLLAEELATPVVAERSKGPSTAVLAGAALFLMATIVFVAALMGLLPGMVATPTQAPTEEPSADVSESPAPTATPTLTASPTPQPTPNPSAAPTPVPSITWPPGATASRMELLVPCAGVPDCWIYTVRGPGPAPSGNGSGVADTLQGICVWFGVSVDTVIEMNPWAANGILPGDELKIPPPTR